MSRIENFTLHNDRGQTVLASNLLTWKDDLHHPSGIFGPVLKHSWQVDDQTYERLNPRNDGMGVLPRFAGFIVFESAWKPDNCLLLDVYGKERMRLTVPRHLTGGLVDPSYETGAGTFCYVCSTPYVNPKTGVQGQFGVEAYVEEGRFYFELNYHTGEFLWGRQIRD